MKRRGQITLYVIIAIVLVAIITGLIYLTNQNNLPSSNQDDINSKIEIINQGAKDCLSEISALSINEVSLQGGYNDRPEFAYDDEGLSFIAFHYHEGKLQTPSKEQIEQEISNSIDSSLSECIAEISNKENIRTNVSSSKTNVKINPDQITINSNIDVVIKTEESTSRTIEADTVEYYPLSNILEIVDFIKEVNLADKKYICLACIDNEVVNKNMTLIISPYEDSQLFTISKNISDEEYTFRFLIKYDSLTE